MLEALNAHGAKGTFRAERTSRNEDAAQDRGGRPPDRRSHSGPTPLPGNFRIPPCAPRWSEHDKILEVTGRRSP